jgi:uncharacterized protein with von Willebrand factor type A (vWA) domain
MSGPKNIYACGVALAFVRQAIEEGSTYFLRFFDDNPGNLEKVQSKADAQRIADILMRQPFSGGGTSIQRAVITAVEDITKSPEDFEKAEIMIISDGEDNVCVSKENLKGIKLHSTIIDGNNAGLKSISETYTQLRSNEL